MSSTPIKPVIAKPPIDSVNPAHSEITLLPVNTYAKSTLRQADDISLATRLLKGTEHQVLSTGNLAYQQDYESKVAAYKASHGAAIEPADVSHRTFFRNAYQTLLNDILSGNHPAAVRQDGQALDVNLEELLGKEGMVLCLLALEEEVHSIDYRVAVFERAVSGFGGPVWEQQPSIIIAGPSGSGKSVAAESIMEDVTGSPLATHDATNFLVNVDGEHGRKVSHVFANTRQLAVSRGFIDGVTDLHDKTKKHTEGAKQVLRAAAFAATELGTAGHIMPETLTDYFASSHIRDTIRRFLGLSTHARVQSIFVEIDANQDAVRHDAEARAKTQSKAYKPEGFKLSLFCSTIVKKLLIDSMSGHMTYVTYTNDRMLVKPTNNSTGTPTWVKGKYGDDHTFSVSKRVFQAWLDEPATSRPDLPIYAKQQKPKALLRFENGLSGARQRLTRCLIALKKQKPNDMVKAKIQYMETVLEDTKQAISTTNVQAHIDKIIDSAKTIKVNDKILHPQFLFSAREREAITAVTDALANKVSTPEVLPSLSGQSPRLFDTPKRRDPINLVADTINKLNDYIQMRKQEDKTHIFRGLFNLLGTSAKEKIAVANKVLQHLHATLSGEMASLHLSSREVYAAKQGRLGEIVKPLILQRKLWLIPTGAATTDDLPDNTQRAFAGRARSSSDPAVYRRTI